MRSAADFLRRSLKMDWVIYLSLMLGPPTLIALVLSGLVKSSFFRFYGNLNKVKIYCVFRAVLGLILLAWYLLKSESLRSRIRVSNFSPIGFVDGEGILIYLGLTSIAIFVLFTPIELAVMLGIRAFRRRRQIKSEQGVAAEPDRAGE